MWQVFTFQTCCRQKFTIIIVMYQHHRMPFPNIHVIRHYGAFAFVSSNSGEEITEYTRK